jgi:ATP-dependent RNA helicase HelY
MPSPAIQEALAGTVRIWAGLVDEETELGLPTSREPQLGFTLAVYRWARQDRLDAVLSAVSRRGAELSAGDFIRWCKQVLDLLDQLAEHRSGTEALSIAGTARAAAAAVRRGVVAQSMRP